MFQLSIAFIQCLALFLAPDSLVYQLVVGSYTGKENPGIEVYEVNATTGASKRLYARPNSNASYLATTSDRRLMYAVSEEGNGSSALTAYKLDDAGEYQKLNSQPTIGDAPCFVSIREATGTVYTANYLGGSLSVFQTKEGSLLPIAQHIQYKGSGVNKSRQESSHAHNVILSPDQMFVYVTDLGTDKIYQHRVLADGKVEENFKVIPVSPGNGPRHLVFDASGNHAYLMNEMKGLIDVFEVKGGDFRKIQTVVADTTQASTDRGSADIHLSPNGKWLISSNRITNNDLAIFSVRRDGTLKAVGHQPVAKKPRNFSFTPNGKFVFVASQDEDRVQVFAFNDKTGKLTDTKQDITVKMPVCLDFRSKGK
jgi:6-phosphogluconolactonase (cycloisomerase 2 family)